MGWSDIDGIIQSFVRGQDFNSVPTETGQPETQLQVVPQTMSTQQPGGDSGSGIGNHSWIQGLPEADAGAATFDDLLFGFNGSALDSFF